MGLIGVTVLIGIYLFLVYRILLVAQIAQRVGNGFGAFIAYGVAIWFSLQSFMPMISYGGSSMLACCLALGVVMRVSLESRLSLPESEPEL